MTRPDRHRFVETITSSLDDICGAPNCGLLRGSPKHEPVLDRRAAIAAGVAGAQRADDHALDDWKHEADEVIERLAYTRPFLDSDDVWAAGLRPTHENRALGARMKAAARRGLIAPTDEFHATAQVRSHGSPCRVWRSLVYRDGWSAHLDRESIR